MIRKDKQIEWKKCQENNSDPYGGCAINVAIKAMDLIDEGFDFVNKCVVTQANRDIDAGITGFMAGAIANMISEFHDKGEEFRLAWNKTTQIGSEGDKATESGKVLNPALLVIGGN